jgi:hypothetical protein
MRARGGSAIPKAEIRTRGENALEGRSPRRHRRAGPFGARNSRTSSLRDRSPEVDRVRTLPWGARRSDASNARRAGTPERAPERSEEKALKGEACGRSRAARCGEDRRWSRDGGSQTPDVAPCGAGRPASRGSVVPACVARRKSPGKEASFDGPTFGSEERCGSSAMGLCRGARAYGRPPAAQAAREARSRECPAGVETPCGSDGSHHRPSGFGFESSECRATPRECRSVAARRPCGSHDS